MTYKCALKTNNLEYSSGVTPYVIARMLQTRIMITPRDTFAFVIIHPQVSKREPRG